MIRLSDPSQHQKTSLTLNLCRTRVCGDIHHFLETIQPYHRGEVCVLVALRLILAWDNKPPTIITLDPTTLLRHLFKPLEMTVHGV